MKKNQFNRNAFVVFLCRCSFRLPVFGSLRQERGPSLLRSGTEREYTNVGARRGKECKVVSMKYMYMNKEVVEWPAIFAHPVLLPLHPRYITHTPPTYKRIYGTPREHARATPANLSTFTPQKAPQC